MKAYAKINLALVVGDVRPDGLHEIASVMQRIDLADDVEVQAGPGLSVAGFEDSIVRDALIRLAEAAGVEPHWHVTIDKRIPVAAGLGGGSADAAAALLAANAELGLDLAELAAAVGSDVPFFLEPGPKLAQGAGELLTAVELPQDYAVVVAIPHGEAKASTGEVYARFDAAAGFAGRRDALRRALETGDISAFPPNDLARSPLASDLLDAGAFRADVSGAGPAVYGLFADADRAEIAAAALAAQADVWLARPVW